jgi:hypothetical protein
MKCYNIHGSKKEKLQHKIKLNNNFKKKKKKFNKLWNKLDLKNKLKKKNNKNKL